ncbi:MAG: hypothetical protein IPP69_08685 [Flavobacteriales bacterium]|nr:hypothetical protein [Flavobacteriales bacterium]
MRKVFTLLFVTAAFCLMSIRHDAQSTPQIAQYFYVLASDLNVDNYATLHQQVKNDGRFEIASACIPSHVLKIKVIGSTSLSNSTDDNKVAFKTLISTISLGTIATPENYNEQMFMDACRASRTGN